MLSRLAKRLHNYMQLHPELAKDKELQTIVQNADVASTEAKAADDGQKQQVQRMKAWLDSQSRFADGLHQYGDKLSQAAESSRQLAAGLGLASAGMDKWQEGFQKLNGGIASLADGSRQLQTGTVPLAQGMLQLVDGSGELSKSLAAAAQETSGVHASDSLLSMFSRPVQLKENPINAVPNYGTAMAPYFLVLGLFVGGLIASNIIPFNRKAHQGVAGGILHLHDLYFHAGRAFWIAWPPGGDLSLNYAACILGRNLSAATGAFFYSVCKQAIADDLCRARLPQRNFDWRLESILA